RCVFAPPKRSRVITAPHANLAKTVAQVQRACPRVAVAHFEPELARAPLAAQLDQLVEEKTAMASALLARRDREVQQVHLVDPLHRDEIADDAMALADQHARRIA